MNYNIHEIKTGKSSLLDWIISFLSLAMVIFIYSGMMHYWIPVGTLLDVLLRRLLFIFVFTFISGIHIAFKKEKSPSEDWTAGKPWYAGIIYALVIEIIGFFILYRDLQGGTFSEVLKSWISQWWVIVFVILMGIAGRYLGQFVGQKWHKKWLENRKKE